MAISEKLFDALYEAEKLNKELSLGYHKSYVRDITDGEDQYGMYICLVLEQVDTGVCTAPNHGGDSDAMRFKDVVRIRRGENRINRKGYATQRGDGWKRFFDSIFEQIPELKKLGWPKALAELQGKMLKVWYTRTSNGYINISFSESAYNNAIANGYTGADEGELLPEDGKVLNEDCPF